MNDEIFYILAPGKSINNVTEEEWEFLQDKNTISFSNFVFANKRTKYHFSYEKLNTDMVHLQQMKKNGFLDTHLLLGIPETINYAKKLGFSKITKIRKGSAMPFGGPWKLNETNPKRKFKDCRNYSFNQPMFRYRGSLSSVITSALILRAKEIRLVGVDLNSQYYFFDGNEEKWANDDNDMERMKYILDFQKTLIQRRLDGNTMVNNYKPEETNDTNELYNFHGNPIRGMGDLVIWMDKELREEGMNGIYTTSKDSYFYNKLKYKGIMDE